MDQAALVLGLAVGLSVPRGRAIKQEELRALFRVCAADLSPAGRRDAAMLAVLYGGGLRRAELCGLDVADFDTEGCTLAMRSGKGRRDRTVYLSPDACEFVRVWHRERGFEPGPLFCPVSSTGQVRVSRLGGESLWYVLRRRLKAAEVEGITPHSMRRAYVTDLLDAGVDVFTVQRLAGHADAVTTVRYDRRREDVQRHASTRLRLPAV